MVNDSERVWFVIILTLNADHHDRTSGWNESTGIEQIFSVRYFHIPTIYEPKKCKSIHFKYWAIYEKIPSLLFSSFEFNRRDVNVHPFTKSEIFSLPELDSEQSKSIFPHRSLQININSQVILLVFSKVFRADSSTFSILFFIQPIFSEYPGGIYRKYSEISSFRILFIRSSFRFTNEWIVIGSPQAEYRMNILPINLVEWTLHFQLIPSNIASNIDRRENSSKISSFQ